MRFLDVLGSEFFKLRRTLAIWVVVLAPGVVTILMFFVLIRSKDVVPPGTSPWSYLETNVSAVWAMLMLPLMIALQGALLGHVEETGRCWKQLCSQPVPRWVFHCAKLVTNLALALLATMALILWVLLGGLAAYLLKPELEFTLQAPSVSLWLPPLLALVAAGPLLAIQSWVSLRFGGVVLGLAVGIAGTVANTVVISSKYVRQFPWSFPLTANLNTQRLLKGETAHFENPGELVTFLGIATASALVLAAAAIYDLQRRDVV